MPLIPGARLGPYEIVSLLGAGGMGEVYRATDSGLKRQVAIKVLPSALSADADRLARFQREAEVLAALNHPNVAHIHGLEKSDGTLALVMELIEGPTLADRIPPSGMPLDEALPIAKQIAEALEAAHELGIVHRDLKPANIKVRDDGIAKVLDFGLAKAMASGGAANVNAMNSPTISMHATQAGFILGTAAYMSPEQARGKAVDKRADIWAFGAVLYEMITGGRAFDADDISDTLALVITKEPDWTRLPDATPAPIRRLLRRCLERDPKRRLPDIAVARLEIDDASSASGEADRGASAVGERRPRRIAVLGLVAGAIVAAGAGATAAWLAIRQQQTTAPRLTRYSISLPGAQSVALSFNDRDLAFSPDGMRLVYTAGTDAQLMVRSLDSLDARMITGIANARAPFVSDDGRWIGFFDQLEEGLDTGPVVSRGALKKVSMTGGPPTLIAAVTGASRGASWGPDDAIVFATSDPSTGLLRVPAGGGDAVVLTKPDASHGERDHFFPSVLPGGRGVLFTIIGSAASRQVAVLDLKTGQYKVLIRSGAQAEFLETGHLVYTDAGALWAVRLDLGTLQVIGEPVPVVEHVMARTAVNFAVSRQGTLAYAPAAAVVPRTLVWVDRAGKEDPIAAPAHGFVSARLSPDNTRAAVSISEQENNIWTWDFARRQLAPLTIGGQTGSYLTWTPDGRHVIFSLARRGLTRRLADGAGADEILTSSGSSHRPNAVSPDGQRLVFEALAPKSYDLMMLDIGASRGEAAQLRPLIQTPFDERSASISPDGRWIVYESNESSRSQIYVRPFPNVNDAHYQISTDGGRSPVWSPAGRELFFVNGSALMAVAVQSSAAFSAGNPVALFENRSVILDPRRVGSPAGRSYDVSRDGQHFLMIREGAAGTETPQPPSLVVVQNWFAELKRLVPVP